MDGRDTFDRNSWLLLVVYRAAGGLLAGRIGSSHAQCAALTVHRYDDATADNNFAVLFVG
jgi:hypothetical protein